VSEYADLVAVMPCDETLLADLGRAVWAAARLHAGVRDALNAIEGVPSDAPFIDYTLGRAITELEQRARRLDPPRTEQVVTWCRTVGRPAKDARDQVMHAITYTDPDGRQALMTNDHAAPGRFLIPELQEVTGQLIHAAMTLPRPPYDTPVQPQVLKPAA
jgi:hypothetical protein